MSNRNRYLHEAISTTLAVFMVGMGAAIWSGGDMRFSSKSLSVAKDLLGPAAWGILFIIAGSCIIVGTVRLSQPSRRAGFALVALESGFLSGTIAWSATNDMFASFIGTFTMGLISVLAIILGRTDHESGV